VNESIAITALSAAVMAIFVGSMMSTHYADATDTYEKTGFTLIHNPMICVLDPAPTTLFPALNVQLSQLAENAIDGWYVALNDSSHTSPWSIFYGKVPYDNPSVLKAFNCDIVISFLPSPKFSPDQEESVGDTTYDFAHHTAKIVIYYLALDTELSHTSSESYNPHLVTYWYIFTGYDQNHIAPEGQILQAITHELGHAFGLGHHIAGDSPSVMMPIINNAVYGVTGADMQELKSLYGTNGFNSGIQSKPVSQPVIPFQSPPSKPTISIPPTVKYEVRDWSMDKKGDAGFVDFLRWLSFENAIKLPQITPETYSQTIIPNWVKKDTKLWFHGDMTDNDFFTTLQYLIDNKIILPNLSIYIKP
jgi:hypothetical protein